MKSVAGFTYKLAGVFETHLDALNYLIEVGHYYQRDTFKVVKAYKRPGSAYVVQRAPAHAYKWEEVAALAERGIRPRLVWKLVE